MDITLFSLQVVLFFFPGILAFGIYSAYTYKQKRSVFEILMNIFVFGVIAYLLYDGIRWILFCESRSENASLLAFVLQERMPTFPQIAAVSFSGIMVGIIASVTFNRKILHKIGKKLKLTNRFGEPDVWAYFFESDEIEWVTIRDFETNLTYQGYVVAYGDTSDNPEILLREVYLYDSMTGEELMCVDSIYLVRPLEKISIEVQKPKIDNDIGS